MLISFRELSVLIFLQWFINQQGTIRDNVSNLFSNHFVRFRTAESGLVGQNEVRNTHLTQKMVLLHFWWVAERRNGFQRGCRGFLQKSDREGRQKC